MGPGNGAMQEHKRSLATKTARRRECDERLLGGAVNVIHAGINRQASLPGRQEGSHIAAVITQSLGASVRSEPGLLPETLPRWLPNGETCLSAILIAASFQQSSQRLCQEASAHNGGRHPGTASGCSAQHTPALPPLGPHVHRPSPPEGEWAATGVEMEGHREVKADLMAPDALEESLLIAAALNDGDTNKTNRQQQTFLFTKQ
nr:PREDICTED: uncharacterized protein LOC109644772 [Paralichthys olivaceus]